MIADNAVIEGRASEVESADAGWGKCGSQGGRWRAALAEARAAAVPSLCGRERAAAGQSTESHRLEGGLRRLWSKLVR